MKRNYNIEVLRCFLMFVIVLGHCCNFGPYAGSVVSKGILGLTIYGVNTFVFISGWYGITLGYRKILNLLGLGLFASCVLSLASIGLGEFRFGYSLGWFGNCYVALMLISPIVNEGLESLRKKSDKVFTAAYLAYAVAMIINWVPIKCLGIDLSVSGWSGLSFNTMLFVYVTGRYLRTRTWIVNIQTWSLACAILFLLSVVQGWGAVSAYTSANSLVHAIFTGSRDYNSPMVLTLAPAFFLLFLRIKIPALIGKVCAYIAPSMFSVYLLHEGTMSSVSRVLYNRYGAMSGIANSGMIVVEIFASAVLIFIVTTTCDIIRRVVWGRRLTLQSSSRNGS